MSDSSPPARPWYRRAMETAALRGWSQAELAERSGVARSTIDKWDTNRRRPTAKSVNAVADALGIPRAEALQLAGVIAPVPDPGPEPPPELLAAYGPEVIAAIVETVTDPEARRRLFERLAERRGGSPGGPSGPGEEDPPAGSRRPA